MIIGTMDDHSTYDVTHRCSNGLAEPVHPLRLDGDAHSVSVLVLLEAVHEEAIEQGLQTSVHLLVIASQADVVIDGVNCGGRCWLSGGCHDQAH